MKKICLLLIWTLVFSYSSLWAACTGGGTSCTKSGTIYTCTDASYGCIQDAVTASTTGDTINITDTTGRTWASTLAITRGISIIGPGTDSLIITWNGGATKRVITWYPDAPTRTANPLFRVSNFTIDINSNFPDNYGYVFYMLNDTSTALTKVVIDNMKIKNVSIGRAIGIQGLFQGVAYSNTFTNVYNIFIGMGYNSVGWGAVTREYGKSSNFFLEDNTINFTASMNGAWNETGQGFTGIVMRYNTFDLTNCLTRELWDIHGLQSMSTSLSPCNQSCVGDANCQPEADCCEQWSTIKAEYYGNIITNMNNSPYGWINHRGSWLLFYNNRLTANYSVSPYYFQYSCDSCQSPSSPAYSHHVQNTYVWNNWVNGVVKNYARKNTGADWCSLAAGSPYTIKANTDYWNYNVNTLNGSTEKGINCGSAAPTSDCSTGDGYWKTDASPCSTPPTTMADMRTYTQSSTFYKCTAPNTWEVYYTPYTYPHPLRGEEITGAIVWGHTSGVTEPDIRTFASGWSGTGTISSSGDSEKILLASGQYMNSPIVSTGVKAVRINKDKYRTGTTSVLKYRTCAVSDCSDVPAFTIYSDVFNSLGYVQIRVEAP